MGDGADRPRLGRADGAPRLRALRRRADPEHLLGVHLLPPLVAPDLEAADPTAFERDALAALAWHGANDGGYSREHATKPQTIGYALTDSPAALCAWIYEKYQGWMDCDGDPETVVPRSSLLDT